MAREFIAKNLDGKYILIRRGETGYYLYPCTDERAVDMNLLNGNSPNDVQAAVSCSMFGWDIPIAKTIM